MGALFAARFVAAHQQVGDFRVVDVDGQLVKNGGNVASYFCTADGRVIHAVVGPASPEELLAEAQWALELHDEVRDYPARQHPSLVALAHYHAWSGAASSGGVWGRPKTQGSREKRLHELFARRPLPPLSEVYDIVFEDVLGQRLSDGAPVLAAAERGLMLAEETGRPVLFILHNERNNARFAEEWRRRTGRYAPQATTMPRLLSNFVTIIMPLDDVPGLSQFLGQPPFQAPSRETPLFVIADAQGRQRDAVAGWNAENMLVLKLARGLVDSVKANTPSLPELRRVIRFVDKIDKGLAQELIDLIPQVQAARAQLSNATAGAKPPA